jgi:tetratricopeptide (TPR) repeat protein
VLRALERAGEAEPLAARALAISEATLGPDHPTVATRLSVLALVLQDLGSAGEAEPLFRRALAIGEAALGPDHPDVAIQLSNLAGVLRTLGRAGEAEPLIRRALAIGEAALGPDHPNVATRLNNLAAVLRALERAGEAEPLAARALAISEATLGPDHPTVATLRDNLAQLGRRMDRPQPPNPQARGRGADRIVRLAALSLVGTLPIAVLKTARTRVGLNHQSPAAQRIKALGLISGLIHPGPSQFIGVPRHGLTCTANGQLPHRTAPNRIGKRVGIKPSRVRISYPPLS